ncbi:MAG: pyridoxal-dependent decarboxylase, exosortase A system-associated [Aquabacterium sp.]|uniref:pyridoxal-dependent decarboxylase, exosortase A system-associated n=1 Tax=Aquabacterium sp. TaxID=1872578 RepID=UPI001B524331|nr:pyridoxal-dependent decarboxylase, exosortase A system-associated [Aquabacterium sp.]MBP7132057.1 pyridoxal-dependent decarboxylase, exosortase A system-associated [Aquabacterium sp.]
MHGFEVTQGQLCLGGVPLQRLAERAGQTPFYAYDRERIRQRVAEVRSVLPTGVHLHYALKANPMPALLSCLAPWVDGMDVASGHELLAALDAGCAPSRISFAGPGKREVELRQALAAGALLHVESFREVELLARLSTEMGMPARVAVRVNPDFELRGAGMRMGGGAQVFGVDIELVPALLRRVAQAGLQFEGFHVYAGSQVLKAELLAEMIERSVNMLLKLQADLPGPVRQLNVGGGWGIPYFPSEQPLDLQPVRDALLAVQQRVHALWPQAQLVVELGRFLVGEAGIYVARVLERKTSRGEVFLVTDGGLHHHLAATGNFGQVLRRNYPVTVGNRVGELAMEQVSVVGPLCTPLDVLAHKVTLPKAQEGDLVVVFQSGAYGATASPQAFLGHPPCVEILV